MEPRCPVRSRTLHSAPGMSVAEQPRARHRDDAIERLLAGEDERRHADARAVRREIRLLRQADAPGHQRRDHRRARRAQPLTHEEAEPRRPGRERRPDFRPDAHRRRRHEGRRRHPRPRQPARLLRVRFPPRRRRGREHERRDPVGARRSIAKRDEAAERDAAERHGAIRGAVENRRRAGADSCRTPAPDRAARPSRCHRESEYEIVRQQPASAMSAGFIHSHRPCSPCTTTSAGP